MSKTKNWINFCGISSESINGLLINELPPIQMTPKKVNKIEIEGRDGDIIEELGYMAYDKNVQISLKDDFDIDEIISWLNNSGPLIFSNEPNKVYTATVYDTVAFERLSRFRKATVKFHVQPFKNLIDDFQTYYTQTGSFKDVWVMNEGNIYSRPIIEAEVGTTGWLTLGINGETVNILFDVEEGKTYSATFDLEKNVFTVKDNENNDVELRNILFNADDFLKLKPGENSVTLKHVAGMYADISTMTVKKSSRWL